MSLDTIKFQFYVKYSCDTCGADMHLSVEGLYKDLPDYVVHYENKAIDCLVCNMLRQGNGNSAKFMGFLSLSAYEKWQEEEEKALEEDIWDDVIDDWDDEEDM